MDNKYKLHGAFSWCELLTTDVPEAKRFYSKLFGWTLEPAPMPGVEYTLVKYGGEQMGGIMSMPPGCEGMPPLRSGHACPRYRVDVVALKQHPLRARRR